MALWRPKVRKEPFPKVYLDRSTQLEKALDSMLKSDGSSSLFNMNSADLRTLMPGRWLSDAVIDSFLKQLIRTCVNSESLRFVLLDPQTIKYVTSPDPVFRDSLVCWGKYFPFHLVDYILWHVHCENHWCLCLGCVSNRSIYWFGPFTPGNHRNSSYLTNSMEQKVRKALDLIMFEYSQKKKARREWKFLCSRKISDC